MLGAVLFDYDQKSIFHLRQTGQISEDTVRMYFSVNTYTNIVHRHARKSYIQLCIARKTSREWRRCVFTGKLLTLVQSYTRYIIQILHKQLC